MLAGTPTRAFATFERGRPLAYALLLDGSRDGMLEDVFTTPAARGRGLASAVCAAVLHAARAERHELVFVPTDADDGAGPLYEALGFERVTILRWFRMGTAVSALAERAIAWRHGYHAAVCGRIEPWRHGTLARADDLPTYYDYNLVRVEHGDPGLDAEALAAAAEPSLADLGHRRIEVEDDAAGARLRRGLQGDGLGRRAARLPAPRAARRRRRAAPTAPSCASSPSRPRGRCASPGRASRSGATRPASRCSRRRSPGAAARAR